MMGLWNNMLCFFGFADEDDLEEERLLENEGQTSSRRKGKVVSLHSTAGKNMNLILTKPQKFEEAQKIVMHIKNNKPVLVNLETASAPDAKKIIDFVSGATFALDGDMRKVNQHIFVFAPANVDVSLEIYKQQQEAEEVTQDTVMFYPLR